MNTQHCRKYSHLSAQKTCAQRTENRFRDALLTSTISCAVDLNALSDRSSVRFAIATLLGYTLLFVCFFSPLLFSDRLIAPYDNRAQSLAAFYCPRTLWTPLLLCGYPAAADPQVQTWYPLSALFSVIPNGWNLYVTSGYIMAGWFSCLFVRHLTDSRLSGIVGGIVFSSCGFLISNLDYVMEIHAAAWLPLMLWAVAALRTHSHWGIFAVGAIAIAMNVLAGHPQTAVYSTGLLWAYVSYNAARTRSSFRYLSACLLIQLIGTGISAVQIIPTAELLSISSRARLPYNEFINCGLNPLQLLGFMFPYLFGGSTLPPYSCAYFGPEELATVSCYVGIIPFFLAPIAITYKDREGSRFWLAVAFLSLLLVMGQHTPLATFTYHLPGYGQMRCITRHMFEFSVSIAVLSGFGVAAVQSGKVSKRFINIVLMSVSGLFMVALIAVVCNSHYISATLLSGKQFSTLPWKNAAIGVPVVSSILSALAFGQWSRNAQSLGAQLLFLAVLVFDLASFGWFCDWHSVNNPHKADLAPTSFVRHISDLARTEGRRIMPVRGERGSFDEAPANVSRLWNIASASGYEPLMPARFSELMMMTFGGFSLRRLGEEHTTLDLLGIRYLFFPHVDQYFCPQVQHVDRYPQRWQKCADNGRVSVYRNPRALPRAWLVNVAMRLAPSQILNTIISGELPDGTCYNPAELALVEASVSLPMKRPSTGSQVRSCAVIARATDTSIGIATYSQQAAFLVLSDQNYPGWKATVDANSVPIVQTNYVQRGVSVPAGSHIVRFRFVPDSFLIGALISTASLLALGVVVFITCKSEALVDTLRLNNTDQTASRVQLWYHMRKTRASLSGAIRGGGRFR